MRSCSENHVVLMTGRLMRPIDLSHFHAFDHFHMKSYKTLVENENLLRLSSAKTLYVKL